MAEISQPYIRDIDGDGVDDMVIVARSKKPMLDAAEHGYRVVEARGDEVEKDVAAVLDKLAGELSAL